MMANNLQQSLRELRSHRKLPEREGEYWRRRYFGDRGRIASQ